MKSASSQTVARAFEVAFLVVLVLAEITFMMGGWWVWLEYTQSHS